MSSLRNNTHLVWTENEEEEEHHPNRNNNKNNIVIASEIENEKNNNVNDGSEMENVKGEPCSVFPDEMDGMYGDAVLYKVEKQDCSKDESLPLF
ncbi:hypothetical protein A2U01_0013643 [Trifolium medium]|uniref:Uncharacterized protein n=1 Tax=Trifolium medium TaxID=97028 RepID=A0A392MZE3_9FABA|nr:hypothetical protein [Trifolium medium]